MDSQAPNKAAAEWLKAGGLGSREIQVRPECRYGNSRFDFYLEMQGKKAFMEVKGVTLEENGRALFRTRRQNADSGIWKELIDCRRAGYDAYVLFVIQMKGVHCFSPNDRTQPEFGKMLRKAEPEGVQILAYDCKILPDEMTIDQRIEVCL